MSLRLSIPATTQVTARCALISDRPCDMHGGLRRGENQTQTSGHDAVYAHLQIAHDIYALIKQTCN